MDRIQLKTDAKDAMRTANPHPVLVALIYTVIVAAVQMIISTFSGFSSMLTSIFGGDSASIFILGMLLPTLLTSIVASFVVAFLELGFVGYTLRVINRQPAGIQRPVRLCQTVPEGLGIKLYDRPLRGTVVPAFLDSRHHRLLPLFSGILYSR